MRPDPIKTIGLLRRALRRAAAAALVDTGVGPRQFVVLRELRQAGPLSQVELSHSTATDPAGMMRAIDALEARGWVRRGSSAEDRRRKIVTLTREGLRVAGEFDAPYEALRGVADGALSDAERRQFAALGLKLAVALDASVETLHAPSQPPRSRAGRRRTEPR